MRIYWGGFVLVCLSFTILHGCGGGGGDCTSHADTYCDEGYTYWMDSCGNLETTKEECECGCKADHTDCEPCQYECTSDVDCNTGYYCDLADHKCKPECVPNCTGKCCGNDGCGGTCQDNCSATGQTCNAQTCSCEGACVPECQGKQCGPDGCGNTCPPGCSAGETCNNTTGQCECIPDCAGKECGPDGCGSTCPPGCETGEICNANGQCFIVVVASNFAVIINRDVDPAPTPINLAYNAAISATGPGDHIVSLQKYFKNEPITSALLDAARRNVSVDTVYMDEVDPTCSSLLEPGDTIDCSTMFQKSPLCHHKNMMILRANGSLQAIVGSYNLRRRSSSQPRVHSVLAFDVGDGQSVFDWYQGAAERLLTGSSTQPLRMTVPTDSGGELSLSLSPAPFNPVLEMLEGIASCDGIVWMSYYDAGNDTTGGPVFNELERLVDLGCDVRVMVDEETAPLALVALQLRGIPARFPTFPAGSGTLGHKIVLADSAGETHFLQSSANLTFYDVLIGNLTAYLRAPTMPAVREVIETELLRYW